jgi:hypothetical protein
MKRIVGKRRRVYNLEVEDCHEFFANNILVHNCDSTAGFIKLADNPDINEPSIKFIEYESTKPKDVKKSIFEYKGWDFDY